jgi:hypothetical protein
MITEQELLEEGFERIDVPKEESGNEKDYFYYQLQLSEDLLLTSIESDMITNGHWSVYWYDVNWEFKDILDVQTVIALHKKLS